MKTTLLLAVSAFVAGSIAGVMWQERRQPGPAAAPGPGQGIPEPTRPPVDGGDPGSASGTPEAARPVDPAARPTVAELRARIPAVLAMETPDGLLSLIHELESRGAEAFPALAELLAAILEQKTCRATGLELLQREAIFSSARLRPFLAWGVSNPEVPPELRERLAVTALATCAPEQRNATALGLLAAESDPDVCLTIVDGLGAPAGEEVPALFAAFQSHTGEPWIAAGILRALAMSPTPEVIRFLEGQEASADEEIARQARVSLREARPPVPGLLVRDVADDEDTGLRPGDIVTKWNGAEVRTLRQWKDLCRANAKGAGVVLEVERNGSIQTITLERPPAGAGTKAVDPARPPR